MNTKVLKSEMILHDDTNKLLAECLSISESRLSSKINGWMGAVFTDDEKKKIKDRYQLTDEKFMEIFF
mgnify:CR=1 FL=1